MIGTIINLDLISVVATILGTIAAWIALHPIINPVFKRFTGAISTVDISEKSYLNSLTKDLEEKNLRNRWSDKFYINIDTELRIKEKPYNIPPSFYVVRTINRNLKEQDFNNLTNVEKIDSSRGKSFFSLDTALNEAQDNAIVVIAPPGSGKTVSLRNLVIKKASQRLLRKTKIIPIFVNLGYYTGYNQSGEIQEFEDFLEDFFMKGGYLAYLAEGYWKFLLKNSECIFFLDGIDELPRKTTEFEVRTQKIKDFVRRWPNTKFILSCRELDYNRELSFQEILIKPFDINHIKTYLKKYLGKKNGKEILNQIENTSDIRELCSNPFYLDLISYFSKFFNKIPENKAQLFNFILEKFIDRECIKQEVENNEEFKEEFIDSLSHLAYYLAVKQMTTTIILGDYIKSLKNKSKQDQFSQMINYAIKGELLEFNNFTGELRFIHNRFLEFFSSIFILKNYKSDYSVFPENAFTNLWWRETILFIAGLDNTPEDLIKIILKKRGQQKSAKDPIIEFMWLEMTILSFDCISGTTNFKTPDLYTSIKEELIEKYNRGNVLEKTKIISALKHDKSAEVAKLLQQALSDNSLWVSERAFFILTEGELRLGMTPGNIMKEFLRFFIEGRLVSASLPILKSAKKSRLIKLFLPVYILLTLLNLFTIVVVGYVFYSLVYFTFFKLEIAFTSDCIRCLISIALGFYIIIYSLLDNNYPILKRFLLAAPLALCVHYLVFNIPSSFFPRAIMIIVGLVSSYLYITYFKRPTETESSSSSIAATVYGWAVSVIVLNSQSIQQWVDLEIQLIENNKITGFWGNILKSVGAVQPYLMVVVLIIIVCGFLIYVINQVRLFNLLYKFTNKINEIFTSYKENTSQAVIFTALLNKLSTLWAQKVFLKKILETMTHSFNFSRKEKMYFLDALAKQVTNVQLKDSIYQHLEDEGNNYRRSINK